MSTSLELKSSNKCYDGELRKYSFQSKVLGDLTANFNIFLPPNAKNAPILYYLAGLTCTEDNGAQKGAFHEAASKQGIAIVYPDTSPRGAKIEGEDESYDFGSGAGFYINATKAPYSKHYHMYDHIIKELPEVLKSNDLPVVSVQRYSSLIRQPMTSSITSTEHLQGLNLRALDGRAWCAHIVSAQSRHVPICFCFCSHLPPNRMCMG